MSMNSAQSSTLPKVDGELGKFHWHVAKCNGDQARIDQVREILQRHSAASALTQSTDGAQRTPLHLAAQRGDVQLARTLLEFGADINAQDSEPATVLDAAVENSQRKFVAFLLEEGVDQTTLQARNRARFGELKRIIEFKKSTSSPAQKKSSRKLSWTTRRGVPTT
ncbi:hypothetical protein NX059_005591 [Plenodomus lindquistii]|nr:hypothetical protein NX059_005591 [Plenodomus lindquistii]